MAASPTQDRKRETREASPVFSIDCGSDFSQQVTTSVSHKMPVMISQEWFKKDSHENDNGGKPGRSCAPSLVDEGDKRTPIDVYTLIVLMEEAIAQGKVEDIPAFLGELERLKGILWSRMMTQSCTSASNHPPDAVTLLTMPQVAKR